MKFLIMECFGMGAGDDNDGGKVTMIEEEDVIKMVKIIVEVNLLCCETCARASLKSFIEAFPQFKEVATREFNSMIKEM